MQKVVSLQALYRESFNPYVFFSKDPLRFSGGMFFASFEKRKSQAIVDLGMQKKLPMNLSYFFRFIPLKRRRFRFYFFDDVKFILYNSYYKEFDFNYRSGSSIGYFPWSYYGIYNQLDGSRFSTVLRFMNYRYNFFQRRIKDVVNDLDVHLSFSDFSFLYWSDNKVVTNLARGSVYTAHMRPSIPVIWKAFDIGVFANNFLQKNFFVPDRFHWFRRLNKTQYRKGLWYVYLNRFFNYSFYKDAFSRVLMFYKERCINHVKTVLNIYFFLKQSYNNSFFSNVFSSFRNFLLDFILFCWQFSNIMVSYNSLRFFVKFLFKKIFLYRFFWNIAFFAGHVLKTIILAAGQVNKRIFSNVAVPRNFFTLITTRKKFRKKGITAKLKLRVSPFTGNGFLWSYENNYKKKKPSVSKDNISVIRTCMKMQRFIHEVMDLKSRVNKMLASKFSSLVYGESFSYLFHPYIIYIYGGFVLKTPQLRFFNLNWKKHLRPVIIKIKSIKKLKKDKKNYKSNSRYINYKSNQEQNKGVHKKPKTKKIWVWDKKHFFFGFQEPKDKLLFILQNMWNNKLINNKLIAAQHKKGNSLMNNLLVYRRKKEIRRMLPKVVDSMCFFFASQAKKGVRMRTNLGNDIVRWGVNFFDHSSGWFCEKPVELEKEEACDDPVGIEVKSMKAFIGDKKKKKLKAYIAEKRRKKFLIKRRFGVDSFVRISLDSLKLIFLLFKMRYWRFNWLEGMYLSSGCVYLNRSSLKVFVFLLLRSLELYSFNKRRLNIVIKWFLGLSKESTVSWKNLSRVKKGRRRNLHALLRGKFKVSRNTLNRFRRFDRYSVSRSSDNESYHKAQFNYLFSFFSFDGLYPSFSIAKFVGTTNFSHLLVKLSRDLGFISLKNFVKNIINKDYKSSVVKLISSFFPFFKDFVEYSLYRWLSSQAELLLHFTLLSKYARLFGFYEKRKKKITRGCLKFARSFFVSYRNFPFFPFGYNRRFSFRRLKSKRDFFYRRLLVLFFWRFFRGSIRKSPVVEALQEVKLDYRNSRKIMSDKSRSFFRSSRRRSRVHHGKPSFHRRIPRRGSKRFSMSFYTPSKLSHYYWIWRINAKKVLRFLLIRKLSKLNLIEPVRIKDSHPRLAYLFYSVLDRSGHFGESKKDWVWLPFSMRWTLNYWDSRVTTALDDQSSGKLFRFTYKLVENIAEFRAYRKLVRSKYFYTYTNLLCNKGVWKAFGKQFLFDQSAKYFPQKYPKSESLENDDEEYKEEKNNSKRNKYNKRYEYKNKRSNNVYNRRNDQKRYEYKNKRYEENKSNYERVKNDYGKNKNNDRRNKSKYEREEESRTIKKILDFMLDYIEKGKQKS